jgi:hypothetical protein
MGHAVKIWISNYLHWQHVWIHYTLTPVHFDRYWKFGRIWIFCFRWGKA